MAAQTDHGVPLSALCPKFLHTNSTSHTWPFSAIAELIDNAYDPDVNAKQFWIDTTVVQGQRCLTFMDNGNGLDHETMYKMLSFGYSDKIALNGKEPIGIYGNGFKSGSMRLGKDAIVFSKSKSSSCIGMLSQTYLEEIKAQQVIVPIICLEQEEKNAEFTVREEHKVSLQHILSFSPFKTRQSLLEEVNAISPPWSTGKTGTRIIIWNLRSTTTGPTEFDFEQDRYDIRIPSDVYEALNNTPPPPGVTSCIPESLYSLRAYCSILYLKPRMQVIIRGVKVKTQLIAKSLAFIRKDHYKPTFLSSQTKRIPITFGYNTKSKDQYGVMMYHKNRLIKAYERVGCQIKANNKGVGVIGVIECNFLEPTHNKQSFCETDKYRKTMNSLGIKLEEYWQEIRHKRIREDPNGIPVEDTMKRPDQNWAQCDTCLKWRKLPDGIDCSKLPDKWHCYMNPDPQFRSCQVEEEPEDSDNEQPSYQKSYKRQQREEKRNQEMKRQKAEEERKRREEQRLADLTRQNQALIQEQEALKRQLRQTPSQAPSTPTTLRSRFRNDSPKGGNEPTTISQAACSPSSSTGLPVISNVCSLSPGHQRGKRTQPATPQRTPKRPKVNGVLLGTTDTPTSGDVSPQSSPAVPVNDDDDVSDDTDDEIFILEAGSTPKPKKAGFDLTKVKTEQEQSDVSMVLECSDDAALDVPSETNGEGTGPASSGCVGTSPSPTAPPEMASTTTQTEVAKVKKEGEDQNQIIAENRAGQSSDADCDACSKQESSGDTQRGENQGCQTLQEGVTHDLNSKEDAGPSGADAMMEAQEQQDHLLELMHATAQERDSFKEQVHTLTCQLQDVQSRLQELTQINVKKECSHQASQTDDGEEEKDYKSLFEKAKQKVNELIQDKEALLATAETNPSIAQGEERDMDEIALQVDSLLRELDERNKERNHLRSQLDSLEEERASLASQCEELRVSLQQQQGQNKMPPRTTDHSVQTDPEEAGGTAASCTDSSLDTSRSLIELRHNIGRLLISFVPALDLGQVNYECNVIDEILEQVLCDVDSVTTLGMTDRAINK